MSGLHTHRGPSTVGGRGIIAHTEPAGDVPGGGRGLNEVAKQGRGQGREQGLVPGLGHVQGVDVSDRETGWGTGIGRRWRALVHEGSLDGDDRAV